MTSTATANAILPSERPKRAATKAETIKRGKLRNTAYSQTFAKQQEAPQAPTPAILNEKNKELEKSLPKAPTAPAKAPAPAPKLPKAVKIATPKKWTPAKPYVALINESKEVVGYVWQDHGQGVGGIWTVSSLEGKAIGHAMSADRGVANYIKKTGDSVSRKDIA